MAASHTTMETWQGHRRGALIPVINPLERINDEIKRRADVIDIFPDEAAGLPRRALMLK